MIATERRDRKAVLILLKRIMKKYGKSHNIATHRPRSYGAAMKVFAIRTGHDAGAGTAIEQKTRIGRSDVESVRRSGFGAARRCRNSAPFKPRSREPQLSNIPRADELAYLNQK